MSPECPCLAMPEWVSMRPWLLSDTSIPIGGEQSERYRCERRHHAEAGGQPRTGAVGRPARGARQIVGLGRRGQQEERVQLTQSLAVAGGIGWCVRNPVEVSRRHPLLMQRGDPLVGAFVQVGKLAELDRIGWTGFGA